MANMIVFNVNGSTINDVTQGLISSNTTINHACKKVCQVLACAMNRGGLVCAVYTAWYIFMRCPTKSAFIVILAICSH